MATVDSTISQTYIYQYIFTCKNNLRAKNTFLELLKLFKTKTINKIFKLRDMIGIQIAHFGALKQLPLLCQNDLAIQIIRRIENI